MIPFISASLYTNAKNQANMISLNKNTQKSEMEIVKNQIRDAMTVALDVCDELYGNYEVNEITGEKYKSISEFEDDCNEKLGIIDRYLNYYKREISDIKIFVDNKPISANNYFFYLGDAVKSESWYKPTIERDGEACWNYGRCRTTKQNHMQVTRAIKNDYGTIVGILCVQLQNDFIVNTITERSMHTILLFNDTDTIYTNFSMEADTPFLSKKLKKMKNHVSKI